MIIGNRRIKPVVFAVLGAFLLLIIMTIVVPKIIKTNKLHNSLEYKLSTTGYSEKDVDKIIKFDDSVRNYILENEYSKVISDIINSKYFILENFSDYIKFHNEYKDYEIDKIISLVNTKSYKEEYEDNTASDTSSGYVVLVNKNNYLSSEYTPDNIVKVSNWYAYEGHKLEKTAYEAFIEMFNDAKSEGMSIVLSMGYRSYKDQKSIFNTYKRDYGERYADEVSTRPGFSEYQTGIALNISKLYGSDDIFDKTDEFAWLEANAYKYGFILRYPKEKEYITKYSFDPNHFRYVGLEAAFVMHSENLTLEEYYAYYIK